MDGQYIYRTKLDGFSFTVYNDSWKNDKKYKITLKSDSFYKSYKVKPKFFRNDEFKRTKALWEKIFNYACLPQIKSRKEKERQEKNLQIKKLHEVLDS